MDQILTATGPNDIIANRSTRGPPGTPPAGRSRSSRFNFPSSSLSSSYPMLGVAASGPSYPPANSFPPDQRQVFAETDHYQDDEEIPGGDLLEQLDAEEQYTNDYENNFEGREQVDFDEQLESYEEPLVLLQQPPSSLPPLPPPTGDDGDEEEEHENPDEKEDVESRHLYIEAPDPSPENEESLLLESIHVSISPVLFLGDLTILTVTSDSNNSQIPQLPCKLLPRHQQGLLPRQISPPFTLPSCRLRRSLPRSINRCLHQQVIPLTRTVLLPRKYCSRQTWQALSLPLINYCLANREKEIVALPRETRWRRIVLMRTALFIPKIVFARIRREMRRSKTKTMD